MKRKSALLLMLLLVPVSSFVFGDVIREVIKNPDGTREVIYYKEGKEVRTVRLK